jgi:dihydroorotase
MPSNDNADDGQLLRLRQPDDWHVHLRDGDIMAGVVAHTARQFGRAIIMPNLDPPITTVSAARAYRERILKALPSDTAFTPLMTAYLTDDIAASELEQGFQAGVFTAAKLYPANATTNSAHGVTNIKTIYPVLERMQQIGMPLLVHGEVTAAHVDIFDREAVFIDDVMVPLLADLPELKVVFEHITTQQAVEFVQDTGSNIAATITPHHLMINRNAMFEGGIRPHLYCLPVVKRQEHQLALRRAATSGSAKFFLGTDSAPHPREDKQAACGCAGIFNAPMALECYATVFEEQDALQHLQAFASENGPSFYGLALNTATVVLERTAQAVPEVLFAGSTAIVPFQAEQSLPWTYRGVQ